MRKRRQQEYWIHPLNQNRDVDGVHLKLDKMFENYPDRFSAYTRMSPLVFQKLISIVGSTLVKENTNFRKSIPIRVRLYIILRYLATGDNMRTISTNFSLGGTTVWRIIHEGLPIIWNCLKEYVKIPTSEKWGSIADEFYERWNLPNCIGAIDGKHVVLEAPPRSGSLYFNYKGTYSIVLLATCDAQYNFTTIDVGSYGKQSDGGIFSGSTLGKKMDSGTLSVCPPRILPNTTKKMPCFFVGDSAFPLSTSMMTLYPAKGLTVGKRLFNYRLSRARRCIENAFGIMAARFRIFRKPIAALPNQVELIVLACVALHNFLKSEERDLHPHERTYCPPGFGDDPSGNDGEWRQLPTPGGLMNHKELSVVAREVISKQMRDDLMDFVLNEGALSF